MEPETKTVDGVTYKCVHHGQKQAYGDSFYEYEVASDLPAEQVEKICAEKVRKAISIKQWRDEYRANPSAYNHFRNHYEFLSRGGGKYFYRVIWPYDD
jgi:hypothetical protein